MQEASKKTAHPVELAPLPAAPAGGQDILAGNLDVIGNVRVRLGVRVGEADLSVAELMGMKTDHVLKLDADLDAPVDVLLDGKVIARGQLVAVDDNFGVRITDLPQAGQ
ncbi:MAG: FliM/FliN family flagellar motor switch protein [Telluria sp.]